MLLTRSSRLVADAALPNPFPMKGPRGQLAKIDANFATGQFYGNGVVYANLAAFLTGVSAVAGYQYLDWDNASGRVNPINLNVGTMVIHYRHDGSASQFLVEARNTVTSPTERFEAVPLSSAAFRVNRVAAGGSGSLDQPDMTTGYRGWCYAYSPAGQYQAFSGVNLGLGTYYPFGSMPVLTVGRRRTGAGTTDAAFDGTTNIVRRFSWFDEPFADADVRRYSILPDAKPIHLIGDSFVDNSAMWKSYQKLMTSTVRSITRDGASGASMPAHVRRLVSNLAPDLAGSTIVLIDGGLTFDGLRSTLGALAELSSALPHGRWLYCEPSYNTTTEIVGTSRRTEMDAIKAAIKARWPNNYVDTLGPMQTLSSANGTEITNGVWGASALLDGLHPTAAGYPWYVVTVDAVRAAKGW